MKKETRRSFSKKLNPSGKNIQSGGKHEKMSFVDREIAKKGHLIHKLKAKDSTGRWAYYFVLVEPPKEEAFRKAIDGDGMIDLEDFGQVIASNYGEEASEDVKGFLKEKYNFDV